MNWIHRRPFRHQANPAGGMTKQPKTFREHFYVSKPRSDQPIDAIRLQLADYNNSYRPCPVHPHRVHPYITTLSDHRSSRQATSSSVRSVSTFETDLVHQRVSTLHSYPSQSSLVERQAIIDEDNQLTYNENEDNRPSIVIIEEEEDVEEQHEQLSETNQCRTCAMLMDVVDQQNLQIRQYIDQISQQADLLAKLARRIAGFQEGIDDQKLQNKSQQQIVNLPITM